MLYIIIIISIIIVVDVLCMLQPACDARQTVVFPRILALLVLLLVLVLVIFLILVLLPSTLPLDVNADGWHERRRLRQGRKVAVQRLPQGVCVGRGGGVGPWPRCKQALGFPGAGSRWE